MMRGGIFPVYKPVGLTSAQAVAMVKKQLLPLMQTCDTSGQPAPRVAGGGRKTASRRLKVGHGGTLDKAAEGVLVIGVGKACKELGTFLRCDKEWVGPERTHV